MWATGGRFVATEDAYVQQDRVSVMPQVSGQIARVGGRRERSGQGRAAPLRHRRFGLPERRRGGPRQASSSARLEVERLKAAYRQAVVRGGNRPRRAGDRADPRRPPAGAAASPGSSSQAAADDSALALQQAKGALAKAESGVLSAPRRRSPAIPTSPPTVIPRCCRRSRRCTPPSSTSPHTVVDGADRRRHQPDRPAAAGPVRDARRRRWSAWSRPGRAGSRPTSRKPT